MKKLICAISILGWYVASGAYGQTSAEYAPPTFVAVDHALPNLLTLWDSRYLALENAFRYTNDATDDRNEPASSYRIKITHLAGVEMATGQTLTGHTLHIEAVRVDYETVTYIYGDPDIPESPGTTFIPGLPPHVGIPGVISVIEIEVTGVSPIGQTAAHTLIVAVVESPTSSGGGPPDDPDPNCTLSIDNTASTVRESESATVTVTMSCFDPGLPDFVTMNINVNNVSPSGGNPVIDVSPTSLTLTLPSDSQQFTITPVNDETYTGSPKEARLTLNTGIFDTSTVVVTVLEDEVLQVAAPLVEDTNRTTVATLAPNSTYLVSIDREGFPVGSETSLTASIISLADDTTMPLNPTRISSTEIEIVLPTLSNPSDYYVELTVTVETGQLDTGETESRSFTTSYQIIEESLPDSDNDGVPDEFETSVNLPEVSQGGQVALGQYARRTGDYQADISSNVETFGIAQPPGYGNEGIYDFVVFLDQGQTDAWVAIQLPSPLTSNKEWLQYEDGEWEEFEVDAENTYYSVSQANCVPPTAVPNPIPEAELTTGHDCVILQITDGGPNDADGEINGIIVVAPSAAGNLPSSGGGGTTGIWLLLLLALLVMAALAPTREIPKTVLHPRCHSCENRETSE